MANPQPRTDAELRRYHEQVAQAMDGLDRLPRPIRLLIHEYGVLPVQRALQDRVSEDCLRAVLESRRSRAEAERLIL